MHTNILLKYRTICTGCCSFVMIVKRLIAFIDPCLPWIDGFFSILISLEKHKHHRNKSQRVFNEPIKEVYRRNTIECFYKRPIAFTCSTSLDRVSSISNN